MAYVLVAAAAVAVFVIAAWVIGRETARLASVPARAVIELDDAVRFIADRVPFEVGARLRADDVSRILVWHAEFMDARGMAGRTADPVSDRALRSAAVLGGDEALAYVIGKADAAAAAIDDGDIQCVLELQVEYLQSIGALGEALDDPARGDRFSGDH